MLFRSDPLQLCQFPDPVQKKKCSNKIWKLITEKLWSWDTRGTYPCPHPNPPPTSPTELPLQGSVTCAVFLFCFFGPSHIFQFPLLSPELLKDKLRHITIFKSVFEQKLIRIEQHLPEVVRRVHNGSQRETFIVKKQKQSQAIVDGL